MSTCHERKGGKRTHRKEARFGWKGWWDRLWRRNRNGTSSSGAVFVDGETFFDALEEVRTLERNKGWCPTSCSSKESTLEVVPEVKKDPKTGTRSLSWKKENGVSTGTNENLTGNDARVLTSNRGRNRRRQRWKEKAARRRQRRQRRTNQGNSEENLEDGETSDAIETQDDPGKETTYASPSRSFADLVAFLRSSFSSARSGSFDWSEIDEGEERERLQEDIYHVWPIPDAAVPLRTRKSDLSRAKAGETLKEDASIADLLDAHAEPSWSALQGHEFRVRGESYLSTRNKEPSADSLYVCVAADFFYSPRKADHVARKVELPIPPSDSSEAGVPPLLVIHLQVPVYAPTLFGSGDGPGYDIVLYMSLREGTLERAKKEPGRQKALELLRKFCAENTPKQRDRLKVVPRMLNLEVCHEEGLLSNTEKKLLVAYREKPVLTRPQHRFFAGQTYLEVCLDVHKYAYMARKGLHSFRPRIRHLVFDLGLVLQGNEMYELPEVMLGGVRLRGLDFTSQETLEDVQRRGSQR